MYILWKLFRLIRQMGGVGSARDTRRVRGRSRASSEPQTRTDAQARNPRTDPTRHRTQIHSQSRASGDPGAKTGQIPLYLYKPF